MTLEELCHLFVRHEFATAGLCLALSNGYACLIVQVDGFCAFDTSESRISAAF